VLVHANSMNINERTSRASFAGAVDIQRGKLVVRTPEKMRMEMTSAGQIESLRAGKTAVSVELGTSLATGSSAVYQPTEGRLVLTGKPAIFKDDAGSAEGRSLTLHTADDRIVMSGLDVQRTVMRFKKGSH
jgi:lipopolysaccharide export system protein LptA